MSSLDGPRLLRTVSSTPSFHIPSLSGMLYLQGMICHSSNAKSSLLTCVMAVHSTNHALTAVIMILKDRNSLHIKIKIKIIHGISPAYLKEDISLQDNASHQTRSVTSLSCQTPRVNSFGLKSFFYTAIKS